MNIKPLIVAGLLAAISSSPLQAAVPSLALRTQTDTIRVGDVFDVDLIARDVFADSYADDLLLAFGFNLNVSPALLGLNASWLNPLFSDDAEILNLDLAGSAFPGLAANDFSGDLHLGTLRFQALADGATILSMTADPADLNQGLIYLFGNSLSMSASLNVNIAAVPLPPAGLLFASGAWLTWRGKRRLSPIPA
ncbi:hypothetical protein NP590_05190 [Methylomonas sp. SURF-2]|uniref:PEP-CTERM protein-sorting domain-containing protein n=1 Tax=Methylomonas subterranea TaxID=2952225 RepID=A0ABT1TDY1_9GAMM|nr:hypothetical protein [Methylomonas sp. SURF-2]MCQ8103494.1 hypothetical protein [Methylomonas sp. SURF-2]